VNPEKLEVATKMNSTKFRVIRLVALTIVAMAMVTSVLYADTQSATCCSTDHEQCDTGSFTCGGPVGGICYCSAWDEDRGDYDCHPYFYCMD
jgi:hypothetical protein